MFIAHDQVAVGCNITVNNNQDSFFDIESYSLNLSIVKLVNV